MLKAVLQLVSNERLVCMKAVIKTAAVVFAIILVFSALSGASANGAQTTLEEWASNFNSFKNDTGIIALTPGTDESKMNFAWLSPANDFSPQFKISKNAGMDGAVQVKVADSITVTGSFAHKAAASNLEPNTVYYYSYTEKGVWSTPESFKTGGGSNFKAILVSDPQIGRSGDEKLDEVLLRDSYGWDSTLETALASNPDINFILSAGDQVETAYTNTQYNLFLAPELLRNIPVAAAMGNHDFYFPLYKYHFNNPNEFKGELIESPGGSGYWFTYGQALFIVIDSTMPLPGSQSLLIKQAVKNNPDSLWRIVMMHNSIYGANGDSSAANLWRFYAPVFDEYKIDLVLSGHDHVHCRTYPISNNKIVDNGEGVVYLSENSASGSKFSSAPETKPWYAANCSQVQASAYSVLDFKEGSLTINTYRADTMEKIDDEYTINKQKPSETVKPAGDFLQSLLKSIQWISSVLKASFQ